MAKSKGKKGKGSSGKPPILVAVDFSAHAQAALLWALEQATCQDKPLVALHVVNDPFEAPGYYTEKKKPKGLQPMEDVAAKMMRHFLKDCAKALDDKKALSRVEPKLVHGLVVTRILEVAEKIGADHIVMGSQGRTGLKRLLIGSKSEQVLRMAKRPVTIVKAST